MTIEGPGTIDGHGAQFHAAVRGSAPPSGLGGNHRPYHVLVYHCEDFAVRNISMLDCAYHSIRVIQSQRVHMDGVYIHNRVNGYNDGFHFISAEYVTVSNCVVKSQDDACAMFGSCKHMTITNSYFSTRWSVFRFGGGFAEDITVSNCLLHEVYGCPIKFHADLGSRFENISFSNLVLQNVTGPINFSVGPGAPGTRPQAVDALQRPAPKPETELPVVRNISFNNIHGTVTTGPAQLSETTITSGYNPGERHSCITLNCVGGSTLENISFDNIHLTFGGGGSAEDAARRDLPQFAGEYFALGPMPAYGFYRAERARHYAAECAIPGEHAGPPPCNDPRSYGGCCHQRSQCSGQRRGGFGATVHRLEPDTAYRIAGPDAFLHFLQLEGANNDGIIVEGGDLSKAASTVTFQNGATEKAVKMRKVL